jgi:REP element-mobilizing transposase RayT
MLPAQNTTMPKKNREKSATGIYHVMLRSINRQDIFEDAEDYKQFIKLFRLLVDRKDDNNLPLPPLSTVYAYCLTNNHVHLLIREESENMNS